MAAARESALAIVLRLVSLGISLIVARDQSELRDKAKVFQRPFSCGGQRMFKRVYDRSTILIPVRIETLVSQDTWS